MTLERRIVSHVELAMGTAFSFDVRGEGDVLPGIADAVAWLHQVDSTFSPYIDFSPISALGRGETTREQCSEEIRGVLDVCEWARVETGGVFDPWNVPAPNGTSFDPSGYVKGWAIENAALIMESHGQDDFCINGGGDVVVRGRPEGDRTVWKVGIRHPSQARALAKVVGIAGPGAVATSGAYERGGHIIDPRTRSIPSALASATVAGPDLGIADIFATAVFVMGIDGLNWIEDEDGYDAYIVTPDGHTAWSAGFNQYLVAADSC